MQVPDLAEKARRRMTEAKTAKIQLTDDLSEIKAENDLKDTLSQPNEACRVVESQRVTNWVHYDSIVEISNQSQLNDADVDLWLMPRSPTNCDTLNFCEVLR